MHRTNLWQVELPDGWEIQDQAAPQFATLFRPDGVGMLMILVDEDGGPERKQSPSQPSEAIYGSNYRRVWVRWCSGQKLLLTYTCATRNAEEERAEVDAIVGSISDSSEAE